ncbi:uncharacterized protein [Trachinotus anak]|uniref:uncharacterized protein n=1 Tax=Trachinotus anak TaxID=443729 RepID=UPI0039F16EA3
MLIQSTKENEDSSIKWSGPHRALISSSWMQSLPSVRKCISANSKIYLLFFSCCLLVSANSDAVSLSSSALIQTTEAHLQISLTVAEPGGDLTLTCPVAGNDIGLFYWYKLNFGYMLQTVASGTSQKVKIEGQFDSPRFSVTKVGDLQSLIVRNVSKEDEATYLCQAGTAYRMEFINGTILAVNDHKNQQKHVYVQQSLETASVQLGASMTLQCSLLSTNKGNRVQCPGEHSVHWFRAGSGGFHPGIIYTNSSRRDEQEERSCVYSLSKTIHNSSDAGTYYCAVVTCGQILFGEGTKVETTGFYLDFSSWSPAVTVLSVLLALCVIVIAILIFSRD